MTIPSFPGAYGWGAVATGGRGGVVRVVNTLVDAPPGSAPPGSFRYEVGKPGPAIIVFSVSGVIEFGATMNMIGSNLTIAGQTAPGDGITLKGPIVLQSSNIIMRYIRWRGGAPGFQFRPFSPGGGRVQDIIFDHCSFSWGTDDTLDIWYSEGDKQDIKNVTIQNSIIAEGLWGHPTGMNTGGDRGSGLPFFDRCHHLSIHRNLFVNNGWRNPATSSFHTAVINNYVYNWQHRAMETNCRTPGQTVDWINNYYQPGPMTDNPDNIIIRYPENVFADLSLYVAGNIAPGLADPAADNWPLVRERLIDGAGNEVFPPLAPKHRRLTPLEQSPDSLPILSALSVWDDLINEVGVCRRLNPDGTWSRNRDAIDDRLIGDVLNGTGPNDVKTVIAGTIPPHDPGVPNTDGDRDGMPDEWEDAHGLNKTDPADGPLLDLSGYANVEMFLNGESVEEEPIMSVITELQAVETALRQEAADVLLQADAVAQAIINLRAADAALDAAADVIEIG